MSIVLLVGHFQISAFHDPNFNVLTEFFLNDHLTRLLTMVQDTIKVLKVLFPKKALIPTHIVWFLLILSFSVVYNKRCFNFV